MLILSPSANSSKQIAREVHVAANGSATIVPIRLEKIEPDGALRYLLSGLQWIDWFGAEGPPPIERILRLVRPSGGVAPSPPAQPRTNLPPQLTSFVGREAESREIAALVRNHRLVTLAGTGGIGKTRLSIEAANELRNDYSDGAWFVELAPISDGALVYNAIASAFGLSVSQEEARNAVIGYLKTREMLLVLDSCEHLVNEVAQNTEVLLRECGRVRILASSREPLGIGGEHVYRTPALSLPERGRTVSIAEALQYGAVALFVDRTRSVNSRFELTEENLASVILICRRLDAVALSIELAAARMRALSVDGLLKRLDARLAVLTGGSRTALPRQQTLRALINWSYDFLPEAERQLFRRLGIFAGSFSLELASATFGSDRLEILDAITSLVDKSLLQPRLEDEDRYSLLESIREYALEKLREAAEYDATARAFTEACIQLAQTLEEERDDTVDQIWSEHARRDLDNWRTALDWAFENDVVACQRLSGALNTIWARIAPAEGRRRLREAIATIDERTPRDVAARLHLSLAHVSMFVQRFDDALVAARRALELYPPGFVLQRAQAELFAGAALSRLGKVPEGQPLIESALNAFRELGERRSSASALQYLMLIRVSAGKLEEARALFSQADAMFRSVKGGERVASHLALVLAEMEFQSGDADKAVALATEALATDRSLRDDGAAIFDLCNLSAYLAALGRHSESAARASEALRLALDEQMDVGIVGAIQHLATVAAVAPNGAVPNDVAMRELGAKLLGFVDERAADSGLHRDFTERKGYDVAMAALAEIFSADSLKTLKATGAAWSLDEAVRAAFTVPTLC